jgi:hypothetical protein
MPPNTTSGYDYLNPTLVNSDIMDWTPAGGTQTQVNVNTWANMNYVYPGSQSFSQKTETNFYIMWYQSIPGNGNTIPYNGQFMTNWWDIIGDWDAAITSNMGLYAPAQTGTATKNVVVATGDSGYGSMRSVINCAPSGSTVKLSPSLSGETLTLLTPLSINKTITVEGVTAPGAWINASGATWAWDVTNAGSLNLRSLQIQCGQGTAQSGLRNLGMTTLHNTLFESQTTHPVIRNLGYLQITGTTWIEME